VIQTGKDPIRKKVGAGENLTSANGLSRPLKKGGEEAIGGEGRGSKPNVNEGKRTARNVNERV